MRAREDVLSAVSILFVVTGCTSIDVSRATDLDAEPAGLRVYSPKVYLFVDGKQNRSAIAVLPDYTRAYDLKPVTILAEQQFKAELRDGVLTSMSILQDNTAFLDFLNEAGETGARAAGLPVSSTFLHGSFGLADGIYTLDDGGNFVRTHSP